MALCQKATPLLEVLSGYYFLSTDKFDMYTTSSHHTQGGIESVVDLTLSNIPRRAHHRGATNGVPTVEARSLIKGRVEYS
jgi:hypothetical protein